MDGASGGEDSAKEIVEGGAAEAGGAEESGGAAPDDEPPLAGAGLSPECAPDAGPVAPFAGGSEDGAGDSSNGATATAAIDGATASDGTTFQKPMLSSGEISCRVCDVRPYVGLAPHGLSDEQLTTLFGAIYAAKRAPRGTNSMVHGWNVVFTLRGGCSSTRGDLMVVDPRDGQKIFSIVSLKRKLGLEDAPPPEAPPERRARRSAPEQLRDDDAPPELPRERPRRAAQSVLSYAERAGGGGPKLSEQIVGLLKENEAAATEPAEGDAASTGLSAAAGLDVVSIAEALHARLPAAPLPQYTHVRQALISLLRSGRVRRSVASAPMPVRGNLESSLQMLVLSTLQVHEDAAAPWRLGPWEGGDMGARRFVWKGATPLTLPRLRGNALVGRRVRVWWRGDREFHDARVVRYHPPGAVGAGAAAFGGMHLVEYIRDGLRVNEGLELSGEPSFWCVDADDADDEAELSESDDGEWVGPAVRLRLAYPPGFASSPGRQPAAGEGASGVKVEAPGEDEGGGADSRAVGEHDDADEAGADDAQAHARAEGPRIEGLMSLATIRNQLPLETDDVGSFHCPDGWVELDAKQGRQAVKKWVRADAGGAVVGECKSRVQLEELLENEAARAGSVWLGQLAAGRWELRGREVNPALERVLDGLIARGLVRAIPPAQSGKQVTMYAAANRYATGDPFPRPKVERPVNEVEVVEEELCELEIERARNIARNQEILRQLGLA